MSKLIKLLFLFCYTGVIASEVDLTGLPHLMESCQKDQKIKLGVKLAHSYYFGPSAIRQLLRSHIPNEVDLLDAKKLSVLTQRIKDKDLYRQLNKWQRLELPNWSCLPSIPFNKVQINERLKTHSLLKYFNRHAHQSRDLKDQISEFNLGQIKWGNMDRKNPILYWKNTREKIEILIEGPMAAVTAYLIDQYYLNRRFNIQLSRYTKMGTDIGLPFLPSLQSNLISAQAQTILEEEKDVKLETTSLSDDYLLKIIQQKIQLRRGDTWLIGPLDLAPSGVLRRFKSPNFHPYTPAPDSKEHLKEIILLGKERIILSPRWGQEKGITWFFSSRALARDFHFQMRNSLHNKQILRPYTGPITTEIQKNKEAKELWNWWYRLKFRQSNTNK